jgi:hypothetical protein
MPSGDSVFWPEDYTDPKWNLRRRSPEPVEGRRHIVGIVGRWGVTRRT